MTDIPIFPRDLMAMLGITHANTLRTHIKTGKVPPPDVQLTQKTRYWWRSTLERAGLLNGQGENVELRGLPRAIMPENKPMTAADIPPECKFSL